MENNNNINLENELQGTENTVETATAETTEKTKKIKKAKKEKRPRKPKLMRNQAFLKRGSFSLAITALVIIAVIIVNVLVGALSKRFNLEFDMSTDNANSISEENINFIKDIDEEISIIMCADAESYVGGYMAYYAQQYNVSEDASQYYDQTVKLMEKYSNYNSKIDVKFLDTQSTEFAEIATKYSNTTLNYGDILVSSTVNGTERFKKIGFTDIYAITEDDTYAAYGYTVSTVSGNNIETALTSAIAYVVSNEDKNIAILTGHSKSDYTESYITLLEQNNYVVDVISDSLINSIPDKYDAIVIAAPTKDFLENEITALDNFLKNGEQLNKGLIYFADAASPYLPNLSDFLAEWGIAVEEGILFETDENHHMPDEKTTIGSYSAENDSITSDLNYCITGYNVPLSPSFEKRHDITVTSLVETSEGSIAAPLGVTNDWTGFDKYTPKSYSTVLQSEKFNYNEDNEEIRSYVMAFSSIEFIYSDYSDYQGVSNKDITFAASERAANAENTGISFISKTITTESFADKVTESSATVIRFIFVIALPLIIVIAGIYVYIKRRNA